MEYLAELTIYLGSGTRTLYFTSGVGRNISGVQYEGRIKNPGSLKLMMFADGTTMGQSQIGYGELILANTDGGLDYLIDAGFSGRSVVIKQFIAGTAVLLMSCSMEQPEFSTETMTVRIKDPQLVLNVPIQPNKYGGSNVLPAGVDGTTDIQGKPKPLLYGQVTNASPICVNTSRLIYQLHDGALQSISAVYDKGVALTAGTAYSSAADMQANPPEPGQYRVYLAGGQFRLGSSPFGQVTADAIQGATAADRTAAQIAKTIALKVLTSGDLVAGDFTALDALNSAVIGIYITEETLIPVALDQVLGSIGGWYGFDSANKLNVGRLDAPSGTASLSLSQYEILSLDRLATQDEGRGLPAWKVNLGYNKNFTVQDTASLAGAIFNVWENRPLTSSSLWHGCAYGNGIFVTLTNGSDKVAVSTDGVSWTTYTLPSASTWYDVMYGGGQFIAVAYNTNKALTSPDGINWTPRTLPSISNWTSVAYGNGKYIAVSTSTAAASSTDGITWNAITLPSFGYYDIIYANNLFVAVGSGCATSTDGVTWNSRTIPSGNQWEAVSYGNSLYVAVRGDTSNPNLATSTDAITWTSRNMPNTVGWLDVVYGNGEFIAIANAYNIPAYSQDGITWVLHTSDAIGQWKRLVYANGTYVSAMYGSPYSALFRITPEYLHALLVNKEYRVITASDSSVKTTHLNAIEANINTLILSSADANTEATRILNLRKVRRDYIAVKIKRSAISSIPDMGSIIQINYPRFGYTTGKLFTVIGLEMFLETDDLTLFLWG